MDVVSLTASSLHFPSTLDLPILLLSITESWFSSLFPESFNWLLTYLIIRKKKMLKQQYDIVISTGVYSSDRPWCWLIVQSVIRVLELSLACMLANLTKQPVNVIHHTQYTHPLRAKLRGSFFIWARTIVKSKGLIYYV